MKDIFDIVFSYEKVKIYLEQNPGSEAKVKKCINEIRGDYRDGVLSALETFMDNTFVRLYDGFNLELPKGFDLKETIEKYHVVLCPNHQSHADYIALQYIFYKKFHQPVYIAAGINLNIFPIGEIFKKCGAFFIRRRFDDEAYKVAFQAYIYYLLKTDKVVEFFFEGGRTRTGKLLSPRFGLFSMILDAHTKFNEGKKPLLFIPVSIAHEHIPEEGSHVKELSGVRKVKEKPTQLLKLFRLFNKKLGTVHVKFGEGIVVDEEIKDLKSKTQELAFETFRRVGENMPITPSALLALIMLDEPSGKLTWKQIEFRGKEITQYCQHMEISLTKSLVGENCIASLKKVMDMFINNKKVDVIKKVKLNQIYYRINEESRPHLLFHKNMILHHFFVPAVVNMTWFNMFNGSIKTQYELLKFLLTKRKELKFEFYLPQTEKMLQQGLKMISYFINRKIDHVDEILKLSNEELYLVASKVRPFSTALSYIYESYYVGAISVKYLADENFSQEKFLTIAKELYQMEIEHGRIVKYFEAYTVPKMLATLEYFENIKVIEKVSDDVYKVSHENKLGQLIEKFAKDVNDQVSINIKLQNHAK